MTRGLNGAMREITRLNTPSNFNVCTSCRQTYQRRHGSTATAESSNPGQAPPVQHNPPVTTSTSPQQAFHIRAGVVLSRPPLITRDLTPFEKAFFLYQRRLNERLALPFPRYFYYAKNTPQDVDWKRKVKERLTPARDIGLYHAYGKEGWNDELLVGARESEPEEQVEALLKDAVVIEDDDMPAMEALQSDSKKEEMVERPMPRVTEADENNDVRSLNRKLARTLYLVVKGKQGGWEFPSGIFLEKEALHRAAERLMVQAAGVNMNTWIVGNMPVGFFAKKYRTPATNKETKLEQLGEKTFFVKARILAGQANLKGNNLGLEDFKWLAKEEVEKVAHPRYWRSIKNMLVEQ